MPEGGLAGRGRGNSGYGGAGGGNLGGRNGGGGDNRGWTSNDHPGRNTPNSPKGPSGPANPGGGGDGGNTRDTTPTLTANERSELAWGSLSGTKNINTNLGTPIDQGKILGKKGLLDTAEEAMKSKWSEAGGLKSVLAAIAGGILGGPVGMAVGAGLGKRTWGSEAVAERDARKGLPKQYANQEVTAHRDVPTGGGQGGGGLHGNPFADGARNDGGQNYGGPHTGPATGQGQAGGTPTGAPTISADQNPIGQMPVYTGEDGYDPEQYWPNIDGQNQGEQLPFVPNQNDEENQAVTNQFPRVYGQTPYAFATFLKIYG